MNDKIKIGASACLIGEKVRWDGGHRRDLFLTDTLSRYAEYVLVCPEVECGMGIPRETIRLMGNAGHPRLVTSKTNVDCTDKMTFWVQQKLKKLEKTGLCGFIFKSRSPSCGTTQVKVYPDKGAPKENGVGIFARSFMEYFPRIPVEENSRLDDPQIKENFIENIFTVNRWQGIFNQPQKIKILVDFHTRHKLQFLSHSTICYRQMGKLVAHGSEMPITEVYDQYEHLMTEALALKTSVKKNINVLHHILGYFKKDLSADEKSELLEKIDHYRDGYAPLIAPITLINHYVRKYQQSYLSIQTYLNPKFLL